MSPLMISQKKGSSQALATEGRPNKENAHAFGFCILDCIFDDDDDDYRFPMK